MPKISVIMPVYNVEKYLRECLDSVLAQTMRDFEVICVDDGSTDCSAKILDEYTKKDARIKVYTQLNQGAGPARNLALLKSVGDYVAFMDPDDFYPNENVFSNWCKAAASSNCKIIGGSVLFLKEGVAFSTTGGLISRKVQKKLGVVKYSEFQEQYWYQSYLFKRDFLMLNDMHFPALRRRQDPPFFVETMIMAGEFWAISEDVYAYRCRTCNRKINWLADGGVRLKDNLKGLSLVADLADKNNLDSLYVNNFWCLTDSGAFKSFLEVKSVESELLAYLKMLKKSKLITMRMWSLLPSRGLLENELFGLRKLFILMRCIGIVAVVFYGLRRVRNKCVKVRFV